MANNGIYRPLRTMAYLGAMQYITVASAKCHENYWHNGAQVAMQISIINLMQIVKGTFFFSNVIFVLKILTSKNKTM